MLTTDDLETLIVSKKREIEVEKTQLGLAPQPDIRNEVENKENAQPNYQKKKVKFKQDCYLENPSIENKILYDQRQNENSTQKKNGDEGDLYELKEKIPPDLERYIRRYIGIPAMLKAGEYSPNNPLLRAELNTERAGGDAFLGLGEYERRRNTLRKIRQAQYRQYLDQQAKKKQEDKEQAERERLEREEKERQREERERQILLERERYSPERRRASVCHVPVSNALVLTSKVDTAVQVDGISSPLSVAVQTDDVDLYQLSPSPSKLTQAERELSPRTVPDPTQPHQWGHKVESCRRRRSYGDYDERSCNIKKSNRDKLVSDLRHSYMPSIFDADAIHMRNLQAEKEAAARRQFYQQELKNQILEQQRIREERKSREKMLEQAEMRRLEEQLRMLRVAQEREIDKQHDISIAMKENARDFDEKRTELQREIDIEQQKLIRTSIQPIHAYTKRHTNTSKSDTQLSKLPFYYNTDKTFQHIEKEKKPYSFNIPDNSIFSSNYDVDSYLRKNLNFRDKIDVDIENIGSKINSPNNNKTKDIERNIIVEKALVHDAPPNMSGKSTNNVLAKPTYASQNVLTKSTFASQNMPPKSTNTQNIFAKSNKTTQNMHAKTTYDDVDNISIPVLRHSPQKEQIKSDSNTNLSDAMKKVDDKWKVPAVQKNILKTLPNDQGKSVSILTQLGSIRRQLQLEQLKLDKMLTKNDS